MRPLTPDEPDRLGGFRLIAHLGSGDLGAVYLGVDPDGRPAAVRAVREEFAADPGFRTGFARDAAGASRVRGRFTPPLLGHDLSAAHPWVATGFVAGPCLRDLVRDAGPLPESCLLILARGLAEALERLHGQGCVHRDLSPAHVLVDAAGPRLIGLGIGRALADSAARRDARPPAYTAPEYLAGRTVLPAGDLFSLGAVLLFAATGRTPFGAGPPSQPDDQASVVRRVLREPPDLSGLPDALRGLVDACLDKLPENRPTAARLLDELGGPLPEEPPEPDWLPPRSRAAVTRAEDSYRSVAAPVLGPLPRPGFDPFPASVAPGPRRRGRTLLRLCAVVAVLLLLGAVGVYTLSGPRYGFGPAASSCPLRDGVAENLPPPVDPQVDFSADTLVELSFSPDGATLAVTTNDGVTLWDWRSSLAVAHLPNDRALLPPAPAAFSPDGCLVVQASRQGALVTDLVTGRSRSVAAETQVLAAAFSPDGRELALATDSDPEHRYLHLYDTVSWEETGSLSGSGALADVRYTRDGRTVAAGESGGGVVAWRTSGQHRIGMVRDRSGAGAGAFDVVSGREGMLVPRGDRVLLVDPSTDREVREFVPAEDNGVPVDVVYSASADLVVAALLGPGTADAGLAVWDFGSGEPEDTQWTPPALFPIAISPDGSRLAGVRQESGEIAVYDMEMTLMGLLTE
ncbi:WD40 repeat domain-containing serine/threonine protein kinase [Nocardiopsis sp. CC223A]|uniref:WD40 repeat domain-containing serine/threonine protein kinase n=1 Tax=Nocardiopsis sp. CC223A TaxID=3044051 RepID=UPI0027963B32|nr:WD40 repeat domain-containing serine/threonine protein kinase [Nocardiopsis sp. CC223A]